MSHYHLMGIGGVGMSALASILLKEGHSVSGCDLNPSPLAYRLEPEGAHIWRGHDPEHLNDCEVLVCTTAVPETHPELLEARRRGIPVLRRIELLGEILSRGRSIGITGSHGKTTTSSMISSIFLKAGTDPTVLLGGELSDIGGNARYGMGRYRIAEIDESDPLFQHLALDVAVIHNLEADHVAPPGHLLPNYHASFEDLKRALARFAQQSGIVIYNADWPILEELTQGCPRIGYGAQGEARLDHLELFPLGSRFELIWRGETLGTIELHLPGMHNATNALAAATTALVEGLPFPVIQEALFEFHPPHRRFEKVGELQGALVVDDYAHNPTKVRALLQAARGTGRRVRVVFQPHRYLRSIQYWAELAEALSLADEVILLDVYAAGEQPVEGWSSQEIVERMVQRIRDRGVQVSYRPWTQARAYLETSAGPDQLILTVGAGDVWKLGSELVARALGGAS